MKFTDITELTQKAIAQTLGDEYMEQAGDIAALDSYKLMDVGKDVLDAGSVEQYTKALLSQLGKMVIDAKKYTAEIPSIFVDSYDWGGYVERIYFGSPEEIIDDAMYTLVNGKDYSDIENKFYQPHVSAKIFEEAKKVMCAISLTEDAVKEAFTSWDKMNSFISGIHANIQNTLTLAMEAYAHMLVSAGVAISCKATGTHIDLVTEYNTIHNLTGEDALPVGAASLENPDFKIYAIKRAQQLKAQMKRYTSAFNNGTIATFTSDEDSQMVVLNEFITSITTGVNAFAYNKEDLSIGNVDVITSWQAFNNGTSNFGFDTDAKIMIAADPTNKLGIGTDAVTIENVVGLIYDKRALGLCPYRTKTTSNYVASADFWTEFHHLMLSYVADANFNMVALTLN